MGYRLDGNAITVSDAMVTAEGQSSDADVELLWLVSRCSEVFLICVIQEQIDVVPATRMKTGLDRLAGKLQRCFESRPAMAIGASPASCSLNWPSAQPYPAGCHGSDGDVHRFYGQPCAWCRVFRG